MSCKVLPVYSVIIVIIVVVLAGLEPVFGRLGVSGASLGQVLGSLGKLRRHSPRLALRIAQSLIHI